MKIKKIYYYLGSALLFIVVTLIIGATDIKNILLSFGAYFLGLYVIYSYLNGQVIHFGGITIKNESNSIERLMFFIAGIIVVVMSIFSLIQHHQGHTL